MLTIPANKNNSNFKDNGYMSKKPTTPNSELRIQNSEHITRDHKRAVIFDLDGTLWDARANICLSWNKALAESYPGAREIPVDAFTAQMGKLLPDIGDALLSWLDKSERARALQLCCDREVEFLTQAGGELFAGERETLGLLRSRYGLYIVSNCQSGYIESFIGSSGLGEYFNDILCSGDTGRIKGENIAELIRRNGIQRAVYVGDTQLDLEAARLAGVPFVWASYGFGRPEACDAEAADFTRIPEAAASLLDGE